MDKIKELLKLMNGNLSFPSILAFQGGSRPIGNYCSIQILTIEQVPRRRLNTKLQDRKTNIKNTTYVNAILQINCLGGNILESKDVAFKVDNLFRFANREDLWGIDIDVVEIGEITDRTTLLEETKYDYFSTLDVTIGFEKEENIILENLQSVEVNGQTTTRR